MRIDLSTKEGMDAMVAMHEAGETYAQISPRCHVAGRPINAKTLADRCHKYRRNGVVPVVKTRLGLTRAAMLGFVARGLSPQAAALEIGRDCSVVMWYEKKTGVTLPRAWKPRDVPSLCKADLPACAFLPADLRAVLARRWA